MLLHGHLQYIQEYTLYDNLDYSLTGRGEGEVDWDEKLRQHRERMKRLGIGTISSSTGNLAQSVSKPPPDVVLSTRTSNVMVRADNLP